MIIGEIKKRETVRLILRYIACFVIPYLAEERTIFEARFGSRSESFQRGGGGLVVAEPGNVRNERNAKKSR